MTEFTQIKNPKLNVKDLTQNADNQMYMNLITEAYVSKNTQDFAYFSRFFIQHLFWTMVRAPDKSGCHIFEEKDLDARLEKTDFCIKTPDNR